MSAKHPVRQLQLKAPLEGGVGATLQVKLSSDPIRCLKVLLNTLEGELLVMVILNGTVN